MSLENMGCLNQVPLDSMIIFLEVLDLVTIFEVILGGVIELQVDMHVHICWMICTVEQDIFAIQPDSFIDVLRSQGSKDSRESVNRSKMKPCQNVLILRSVQVFKKQHPSAVVFGLITCCTLAMYSIGSIMVFTFSIALPMLLVLIHASFRMRNLKNKMQNKVEAVGFKKTPMGVLLKALSQETNFTL